VKIKEGETNCGDAGKSRGSIPKRETGQRKGGLWESLPGRKGTDAHFNREGDKAKTISVSEVKKRHIWGG